MPLFLATCGPSAVGKTTQMQRLLKNYPQTFTTVLSVTTRPQRESSDDLWYHFVNRSEIAHLDPGDVLTTTEYRGEQYVLLRSEVDAALRRAPIALMAIRPDVILKLREMKVMHSLICCKVGDDTVYRGRLVKRGYTGDGLEKQFRESGVFPFPPEMPGWPQADVFLGSDDEDGSRFDMVASQLSGRLFQPALL